ncbi:Uncharacterised protein [Mycobacterium tuberculosis]|nr:Uncharacterised protein [Mycobacterium tuberculosis]
MVIYSMMLMVINGDYRIAFIRMPSIFSPCRIRNRVSVTLHVVHGKVTLFG